MKSDPMVSIFCCIELDFNGLFGVVWEQSIYSAADCCWFLVSGHNLSRRNCSSSIRIFLFSMLARTLCCWHVIGYSESSTIHDDVCVLSITGTAATVRGLPDLAQAQRMWQEWEHQQNQIISRAEKGSQRRSFPGDSSPGSVVSTTVETPFSAGAVSDDGVETGRSSPVEISSKQVSFGMSRRALKEAKIQRNQQRLERRLRRMGAAQKKKSRGANSLKVLESSKYGSDIEFVSDVLLRARLARPCSYCHVPYHHR